MAGKFRQSGGFASTALALLLLFRLLIPSGYMIAPDSEGKPGLALCAAPAWAAAEAALHDGHDGHDGNPVDPEPAPAPTGTGDIPCAFAALAAPPLPPEPPVVPPGIEAETLAPAPPTDSAPRRVAPAASPPPARGPPLPV